MERDLGRSLQRRVSPFRNSTHQTLLLTEFSRACTEIWVRMHGRRFRCHRVRKDAGLKRKPKEGTFANMVRKRNTAVTSLLQAKRPLDAASNTIFDRAYSQVAPSMKPDSQQKNVFFCLQNKNIDPGQAHGKLSRGICKEAYKEASGQVKRTIIANAGSEAKQCVCRQRRNSDSAYQQDLGHDHGCTGWHWHPPSPKQQQVAKSDGGRSL